MSALYKLASAKPVNFRPQISYMQIISMVVFFFLATAFCSTAQQFSENDFKPLQSLQGLWKMETGRGAIYEEWNITDNKKLTGRSYRINNADTIIMERIQLYCEGNNIIYSPIVTDQNNQQAVSFKLISNTDNRYVFENKNHDFPQRVIYNLVSKDAVHARIEGVRNGQERGSDFKYSRVK
jgi:hypothetical protein